MLKVLLQARVDAYQSYGGDTYQFEMYQKYIAEAGCQITITSDRYPDFKGYDLYHVNNIDIPMDLAIQMRRATHYGIPTVLMTIHHRDRYMREFYQWLGEENSRYRFFRYRGLKETVKFVKRWGPMTSMYHLPRIIVSGGVNNQQRACLELAQAILLNAPGEESTLAESFGFTGDNTIIIPNGVTPRENTNVVGKDPDILARMPAEYGIVVGRIEPRKNQVKIVEALKEIEFPVYFFGSENPLHKWYFRKFLAAIEDIPHLEYEGFIPNKTLQRISAKARLTILASWFEVVPFSSLDAYAMGVRVVTTSRSYLQDYFKNDVSYCDPTSTESIRACVQRELERENPPDRESFVMKYHWKEVTNSLLKAYLAEV